MSADNFNEIYRHYGHEIVVARYTGLDGEPVAAAVECQDCDEVLLDHDKERI